MSKLSFNATIHAERLPDGRIRITVDLNGESYEIGHVVPDASAMCVHCASMPHEPHRELCPAKE